MCNDNVLPVIDPIIASNTEHGYLLSGLQTNPLSTDWLMSNFVHQVLHGINLRPDMNFYPITNHTMCPCIDYLRISKEMAVKKWGGIIDFLIENIRNQYYVILHVNWFFITSSSSYKKVSHTHPILVYGYCNNANKFMVGDFNRERKFSFVELSFEEIEQGFINNTVEGREAFVNERYLYINDIILYKNRTNVNYAFNLNSLKNAMENYLNSTNVSDTYAQGDYCYFSSAVFGLNSIKEVGKILKKEYQEQQNYEVNYKFITVPLERTKLMLERMKYVTRTKGIEIDEKIYKSLEKIYDTYKILLKMVIKYNLSADKTDIMQRIILKIQLVAIEEERTFADIIGCL